MRLPTFKITVCNHWPNLVPLLPTLNLTLVKLTLEPERYFTLSECFLCDVPIWFFYAQVIAKEPWFRIELGLLGFQVDLVVDWEGPK